MDGKLRAAVVLALAGPVVCGPFSGVSQAWAAAERKPAPPITLLSAKPAASPSKITVLLAPLAYAPADFVAPSYAGWLTAPPPDALPDARFVARGQAMAAIDVFERANPPSVPLPPKRLAEKRSIVLASMAPLPPMRLLELVSVDPQATTTPVRPPDDVTMPRDAAAEADSDAEDPQEDAARSIDDGPEPAVTRPTADRAPPRIEALIERHAERFDVPASLVRRVAWRESKFDPSQRHGPYWGLMQIRVDTARGLGFRGAPKDLLDADTNMTYAVAYLANAYRVAGRDEKRAVTLYAKGYYYEAKRKRMLDSLIRTAAAEK